MYYESGLLLQTGHSGLQKKKTQAKVNNVNQNAVFKSLNGTRVTYCWIKLSATPSHKMGGGGGETL